MEKRIEKWESLRLEAQKFTPQEFVASCDENIIWTWESISENVWMVVDYGQNMVWDDGHENGDKNINPQGSTLQFSDAVKTCVDEVKKLAWFRVGDKPDKDHHTLGYVMHVDSNIASNDPCIIECSNIAEYTGGGGTGVFVFDYAEKMEKNNS